MSECYMDLQILDGEYQLIKLPTNQPIPAAVLQQDFFSVTRTPDELSIIVSETVMIESGYMETGWSVIKFANNMELSLVGVTARITAILAASNVNICALATYCTDYILVKRDKLGLAVKALESAGYRITYENERDAIKLVNEQYLTEFRDWLKNKGLSDKTIYTHISNVDLFLNYYLLYYEIVNAQEGYNEIYGFLDDWLIRKCAWSSRGNIKTAAAGIKKFYAFMLENGNIEPSGFAALSECIKEYMPEWLDNMKCYEDARDRGYNYV